jgi:hypothetical protein
VPTRVGRPPRTVPKPHTGTPAPVVKALPGRLGVGPSQRRRDRPTPRRRPVASADYVATARGENPTGGRPPEAAGQRPATEHLREDHKTHGSPGRCARSTLFTLAMAGSPRRHGTTDPRGQSPGAAARRSSDPPQEAASRVDGTRGGSPGRNGRWARDADEAHSPAGSGQHCEGLQQIPRAPPGRPAKATPARPREQPGRGPGTRAAEEHQPRMTRTGGASTCFARRKARTRTSRSPSHEARGTKTARATRPRLGCRGPRETPERDGPGGRHPRTARRGRHTPKGCDRYRKRDAPGRSVRRRCAGRRIDPGR